MIVLALVNVLFSFGIANQLIGVDEGTRIGEQEMSDHWAESHRDDPKIRFSISGPSIYKELARAYTYIFVLFLAIAGTAFLKLRWRRLSRYLSAAVVLSLSGLILYILNAVIRFKQTLDNFFLELTITLDWVLLTSVALILLIQIVAAIYPRSNGQPGIEAKNSRELLP